MRWLHRERLTSILLHPYWIAAALSAALFFQFALDRGGVESAVWVAGLFLLAHVVAGRLELRELPRREWLFLAGIGCLLLVSWAVAPEVTDPHRVVRLVKLAVIALAVRHLASQPPGDALRVWVAAVAVAIVLWQTGVRLLAGGRYGTFANPHYLAYFALLLLPVLVTAAAGLERRYRYLLYLVVVLDLALVFNLFRTPAIPLLALGTGLGALAWSVAGRRARWAVVGLAIGAAVAAMLMIDDTRVDRLGATASAGDERLDIWSDTARMLGDNDALGWLLGNGIGSFRNDYLAYFQTPYRDMPLPHNHVLELLYENGALLTALIVAFLLHVGWRSLRMARRFADHGLRRIAQCNLVLLGIWFVFSFLAFGAYSRYTLYPLGFILGVHFFLVRRADAEDRPGSADGRAATA